MTVQPACQTPPWQAGCLFVLLKMLPCSFFKHLLQYRGTEKGESAVEQYRMVGTPQGPITYRLVKKQVKNLNLRLERSGEVVLSVPQRCPAERADAFVIEKSSWIWQHLPRPEEAPPLLPQVDRQTCVRLFWEAVLRVYPLVAQAGVPMPQLKLRKMRSQWGNCHYRQGYITLNTALSRCPEHLREYVAHHELVHFLHHDHGPGFYAAMDARMPDWKKRRRELKQYAQALML